MYKKSRSGEITRKSFQASTSRQSGSYLHPWPKQTKLSSPMWSRLQHKLATQLTQPTQPPSESTSNS